MVAELIPEMSLHIFYTTRSRYQGDNNLNLYCRTEHAGSSDNVSALYNVAINNHQHNCLLHFIRQAARLHVSTTNYSSSDSFSQKPHF